MLRLELDRDPSGVAVVRRSAVAHVRSNLTGMAGLEDLLDDVALVTSELVTNAVVHGEPPITVEIDVARTGAAGVVTITCHDLGPWDGSDPDPWRGRGLQLVRSLATVVIDADERGSTVRAALSR